MPPVYVISSSPLWCAKRRPSAERSKSDVQIALLHVDLRTGSSSPLAHCDANEMPEFNAVSEDHVYYGENWTDVEGLQWSGNLFTHRLINIPAGRSTHLRHAPCIGYTQSVRA